MIRCNGCRCRPLQTLRIDRRDASLRQPAISMNSSITEIWQFGVQHWRVLLGWVWFIAGVYLAIHITLQRRSPAATLAWILALFSIFAHRAGGVPVFWAAKSPASVLAPAAQQGQVACALRHAKDFAARPRTSGLGGAAQPVDRGLQRHSAIEL